MKVFQLFVSVVLTFALIPKIETDAQSTANYTLTFSSSWSAATHPVDFPAGPHYSALRGATHNSGVTFWEDGSLASGGIKQMAETGNNSSLNSEIGSAKLAGTAQNDIIGSGLSPSPGSITVLFAVTETHPLVSVVAMLAPSPDWFVGLNGVDLFDGGAWASDVTYTLYAYDAGTDSGTSYNSADQPSTPFVPIFQIPDGPFFVDGAVKSVGSIRFELDTVLGIDFPDLVDTPPLLIGPFPNPSSSRATVEINLDRERNVRTAVYDLLGREVVTLQSGPLLAGRTEFEIATSALPSGLYLLRVETTQGSLTRSFLVMH